MDTNGWTLGVAWNYNEGIFEVEKRSMEQARREGKVGCQWHFEELVCSWTFQKGIFCVEEAWNMYI